MAKRIILHPLPGSKRAYELARLSGRLLRDGHRVVVWVADGGRRKILDDFLWTFEKLSFVPHLLWSSSMGAVDDPAVLVGEPTNPNRADLLLVGDELPPAEWATSFAEVHDVAPPGEAGGRRRTSWEEAGFEVEDAGP